MLYTNPRSGGYFSLVFLFRKCRQYPCGHHQVVRRLRSLAGASLEQQAQTASRSPAGKTSPKKAGDRPARAARQAPPKPATPASGPRSPWFRITPGRVVGLLILAVLSVALPGLGALVLLFAIINAVRRGIRSASESA
jgi:hypothetical protein